MMGNNSIKARVAQKGKHWLKKFSKPKKEQERR
jgi:hypothetical protein